MERLDYFAPPGMGTVSIRRWIMGVIAFSAVFSMSFLMEYASELHELRRNMEQAVYHGMTMVPFRDLIVLPMLMFRIAPVVPLLYVPSNYLYFQQETKSVYLMKRLKNPWEMHLRCWVLPLAGMVLVVAAGCVVYLLYLLYYNVFTPEILLPANL